VIMVLTHVAEAVDLFRRCNGVLRTALATTLISGVQFLVSHSSHRISGGETRMAASFIDASQVPRTLASVRTRRSGDRVTDLPRLATDGRTVGTWQRFSDGVE